MDTLAVRLTIPPVGFVGDFHSQVSAPCRAHQRKALQLWSAFLLHKTLLIGHVFIVAAEKAPD